VRTKLKLVRNYHFHANVHTYTHLYTDRTANKEKALTHGCSNTARYVHPHSCMPYASRVHMYIQTIRQVGRQAHIQTKEKLR